MEDIRYCKILVFIVLLPILSALKLEPLKIINETNLQNTLGCDLQELLTVGSPNSQIWFLLFKIPTCKQCEQVSILFFNTYVQYNKRFFLEKEKSQIKLEGNIMFGQVDCNESPKLCDRFMVPHYPYLNIVETNGDTCIYEGGLLPNEILDYLSERKQGNPYQKCKFVGKITLLTKILGYLQPITAFLNYNTMLFVVAFIVGPFLFGFIFSRNKRLKEEPLSSLQSSPKGGKAE